MLKINEAFYHLQGKDMFVHKSHSHNEVELIEVVTGQGTVIKNDKTYELKSRHIYLIDARNVHIVYPQPEDCRDYIRNKIVIDADSFDEFCKNIGVFDLLETLFDGAPVSSEYAPDIDMLYKKICDLVNTEDAVSIGFAHGYIIELLNLAYSLSKESQNHSKDTTIQKILSIVAEKKGITSLEEISKELHMSKFYVSHMFKNKTGRNISDYISDKVYENAVKMLKENQNSVEEIAFMCGFSSSSAFTRFFKNKSGYSPTTFRKKK